MKSHLGNEDRRREKQTEAFGFNLFGFYSSKGQMILISAMFVIFGLILIFNILGAGEITEEKRFQEGRVLGKTARNVASEYKYAFGIATIRPYPNESASVFLSNFSSYIRDEMDSEIVYASVFVNGTNQGFSVNVGNFLDETINVTVNATDASPASSNALISDRKNQTFYFAAGINGTINVTLSYLAGNTNVVERLPINVSTKNFAKVFFDFTIRSDRSFIRVKDEYNRTW